MSRDPLADLAGMLETTPPPMRPACADEDPHMFDATNVDEAAAALAICASCRVDVRSWCRQTVRPAQSKFDGICAGEVWRGGKTVERTPSMLAGLLIDDGEAAS